MSWVLLLTDFVGLFGWLVCYSGRFVVFGCSRDCVCCL